MRYWNAVESDFQREYQIDLTDSFISWRKFLTLLCNLSGESVFYFLLNKAKEEKENILENPHDIANDIMRNISKKKK